MDRIGFGAAYYAEYQRRPDIDFATMVEADFALMAEAGFSVIRVGESVWSTWEPEDGRFALDWLEPVLDAERPSQIEETLFGPPAHRPRCHRCGMTPCRHSLSPPTPTR